jgi:hypothetical protein
LCFLCAAGWPPATSGTPRSRRSALPSGSSSSEGPTSRRSSRRRRGRGRRSRTGEPSGATFVRRRLPPAATPGARRPLTRRRNRPRRSPSSLRPLCSRQRRQLTQRAQSSSKRIGPRRRKKTRPRGRPHHLPHPLQSVLDPSLLLLPRRPPLESRSRRLRRRSARDGDTATENTITRVLRARPRRVRATRATTSRTAQRSPSTTSSSNVRRNKPGQATRHLSGLWDGVRCVEVSGRDCRARRCSVRPDRVCRYGHRRTRGRGVAHA